MPYNMTLMGNSTGFLGFLQGVNEELMFGWFGISILVTLVTISFISFMSRTGDVRKSFAGAMFISFGLSLLLRVMLLVPDLAIYVSLILATGSAILLKGS